MENWPLKSDVKITLQRALVVNCIKFHHNEFTYTLEKVFTSLIRL